MKSAAQKIQASVVLASVFGVAVWFGQPLLSRGQEQMQGLAPSSMPWRSNKPFKEAGYVGREACAKCHAEESANQHDTAMGKALQTAAESRVLIKRPRLTFRLGRYSYQIVRQGDRSIYSVTDGLNTISEPILYAFGQGKAGQTYVFRHDDSFYESRVSYYREVDGLDITIGYPRTVPPTLEEALGRAISLDEARSCFSCHATAAVSGKNLQLEYLMQGVSCEACHGPGRDHIVAMEAKRFEPKHIFNPGKMSPDELTQEFCGSCHRSAEQVLTLNMHGGINNVRFQPYRIFTSRGHDPNDSRLSCTACHDPHEHLRQDAAFYDPKCFACHRSASSLKSVRVAREERAEGRAAKACPVGRQNCASCHMPKVDLPGAHFKFTDHRIRIARPGEPYPN